MVKKLHHGDLTANIMLVLPRSAKIYNILNHPIHTDSGSWTRVGDSNNLFQVFRSGLDTNFAISDLNSSSLYMRAVSPR